MKLWRLTLHWEKLDIYVQGFNAMFPLEQWLVFCFCDPHIVIVDKLGTISETAECSRCNTIFSTSLCKVVL